MSNGIDWMPNLEWVIYLFRCPDTKRVRYVGWAKDLKARMRVHLYNAREKVKKTYCEKWVGCLLRADKEPIVEVIETGEGDKWAEREQYWIRHYRDVGEPLTNLTDGGEGSVGFRHTEESKRKMSEWQVGRVQPEEFKQKMRVKMRGRVFTDEWKAKISETKKERRGTRGNKLTDEHRKKISEGGKGRVQSEATKVKIRATRVARYGPLKIKPGRVRGERSIRSKLKNDSIRAIREMSANGYTNKTLASMFNVHNSVISRIVARKSWAHVL